MQKLNEWLLEYAGTLCALADKAYPNWSGEQRKEMVRDQFIRGVCSPSIQLKLIQDKPSSLEEAVKWASQQEGVEDAQRKLWSGRKAEALCTDAEGVVKNLGGNENSVTAVVKEMLPTEKEPGLSAQIEQLSRQLDKLKYQLAQIDLRNILKKRPGGDQRVRKGGCWKCGNYGHLKKECPGIFESDAVSSLLTVWVQLVDMK